MHLEDWKEFRLRDFLIPALRPVVKPSDEFRAVGIRSHCGGTFERGNLDPEDISMETLYEVRAGDLIVNITFAWEGAIAIVKKENEGGLVSHRFPTYVFNERITNSNFFCHIFTQGRFRYLLKVISPGGAGRNRVLDKKDFLKLKVRLPEKPEQEKITAFLSALDEKIGQLSRKKELLTQYKKGVMQQIFDQKIRFKAVDGNDFPDWEEKRFGDVAKFSKGKGISKEDVSENGQLECIRYGELYTHYGETISEVVSRTNLNATTLVLSEPNDVIIPASGETNLDIATASCVLRKGIALGGDLNIIRSKLNGVFLAYYLNNKQKHNIARLAQGVSVVHLYPSQLSTLKLAIPSEPEQKRIAVFLSAIDEKIKLVNAQLEKTKTFKKGLLQRMFV